MRNRGCIGWSLVLCCTVSAAFAQQPVPLADHVDDPLLPSGITELPIEFNADLVYLFTDEDGTDAAHFIGGVVLRIGEGEAQELSARQAVVWVSHRAFQDRPYRHIQVLLWRDAEIVETGGTVTSGPALFVTFDTFGEITTNVDDLAFQSSADDHVYREGNAIRKTLTGEPLVYEAGEVSLHVLDASGRRAEEGKPKRKPTMYGRVDRLVMGDVDGQRVMTAVGGAYFSRGMPGTSDYLEIRADSVVIFLPPADPESELDLPPAVGLGRDRPRAAARDRGERSRRAATDRQMLSAGFGEVAIESVYLEGDVSMSQGANTVRASRLYYDLLNDKALILDAVVRTALMKRNLPLYIRAAEVRQLSANHLLANDAILTTSEFHTPHYHIGARRVELINRTPSDPSGQARAVRAGDFRIRHATLNLGGHPIAWWPFLRGRVDTSETGIARLRSGYSDDFGFELETDWHLFNVLGLQTPPGFDATLSLDYFSERGPAVGVDAEYERERYFGLFRSYLMIDDGKDDLGRQREDVSHDRMRGRVLIRHRQFLEDDWQLSLELSHICDEGFLEEFFESEFDREKDQETLLHLKRQRENRAFTAMLQVRILDFTTQTERLPDLAYHVIGEPLGDRATWFSENRGGIVRYRPADQTFRELLRDGRTHDSGSVLRADSRQEVGAPFDLGPIRFVPFTSARVTVWDDSPRADGVARAFGTLGVRSSMYLWRVYPEKRSTLFDINGVRHIIKPDITAWLAQSNRDSDELYPFDDMVEGINGVDGVTVGVRQRWQTKRGADDNRRIVDFLTFDVEMGLFNDADGDVTTNGFTSFSRPESSVARNYVNSSVIWRINDRTALLNELNYDMSDRQIDIANVSFVAERPPRLSYLVGYRYINESDSNLLGFDMNYRITEKHTLAVRELFDLDRGRTLDFTLALIRKFPRWFGAITFELDDAEGDFGVSLSLWPEGLPQAALGSRRFTGLGGSTQIRSR